MRLCKGCGCEVVEKTHTIGLHSMDGYSICTGCSWIEGDTYEVDDEEDEA